jgi:DNA-binding response OmpR family regulator
MRILVAEDDTALASFVKKGLESKHYAVDVSANGEQARAVTAVPIRQYDICEQQLNLSSLFTKQLSCLACVCSR